MFLVREIVANHLGLKRHMKPLKFEFRFEDIEDIFTDGLLLMEAGQQLEFGLLLRRQLDFWPENHLLLSLGLGLGCVLQQQICHKLTNADVVSAAVCLDLVVLRLCNLSPEESFPQRFGLGARPAANLIGSSFPSYSHDLKMCFSTVHILANY